MRISIVILAHGFFSDSDLLAIFLVGFLIFSVIVGTFAWVVFALIRGRGDELNRVCEERLRKPRSECDSAAKALEGMSDVPVSEMNELRSNLDVLNRLRAKGHITAEEYEQKHAELLDRM